MGKLVLLLWVSAAVAADLGPGLIAAAKKGQTAEVQAMLAKGARVDSQDKQGRTALMQAAARGHTAIVKVLLEKGASAILRDRQGWTAWGLAYSSDESTRDAILQMLPAVPPARVSMKITWTPDNLYSSCSLNPTQLAEHVAGLQPDAVVMAALRDAATISPRRLIEFTGDSTWDAVLVVRIRPGASCLAQQTADQLSMALDVKLERANRSLLDKTFGGGLKGMHVRTVRSPSQYQPLYAEWAKMHAPSIYAAAVEAWLRAGD